MSSLSSFLALIASTLRGIEPQPDHDRLHTTLAQFMSRGQTVVEDLPALSLLLEARCSAEVIQLLSWICRIGSLSLLGSLLSRSFRVSFTQRCSCALWIISALAVGLCVSFGNQPSSAITCAVELGRLFAALVLHQLMIDGQKNDQSSFSKCLCLDLILLASFQLGCQDMYWIVVAFLHSADTILQIWEQLRDIRKSVALIFAANLLRLALRCFVCLSLFLCISHSVYPASELAAGGNWNLRFLPASTRRFLRGNEPLSLVRSNSMPRYALVPNTLQSLYLQGAGFLYTDDWTWDETMRIFRPLNEIDSLENTASRATLRDSIKYTGPWTFHHIPTYMENYTYFRNNDLIHIRSGATGKYLAVNLGKASIIDRLNAPNATVDETDDYTRWMVSTTTKMNRASTWALEYSPEHSQKFRLWNTAANCYLATSYRSFPDWDGMNVNDTILQGLRMELETTCLGSAKLAASSWEIVDGYQEFIPDDSARPNGSSWFQRSWNQCLYHYELSKARSALKEFRKHHGFLQDLPAFLQDSQPCSRTETGLSTYAACSFMFLYVMRAVLEQRGDFHYTLPQGQGTRAETLSSFGLCMMTISFLWKLVHGTAEFSMFTASLLLILTQPALSGAE